MVFKGRVGTHRFDKRNIFILSIAALALYVIVPRLRSFKNSLHTLRNGDFAFVGVGVVALAVSFLAAAYVYKLISTKKLPYSRTLLIQISSGLTNRLAPAGAGVIALNTRYLIRRGYSATQAGSLVSVNNMLGFIGNITLLATAAIFDKDPPVSLTSIHLPRLASTLIGIGAICGVLLLLLVPAWRFKLAKTLKGTARQLNKVIHRPVRLLAALLASMAITICYATVLFAVALAFNVHISVIQTLLVLTLGVAAATITPTPGGIGGAEAGLTAALISVGVAPHQALDVALVYRFLTYWLPILPGFIGLQIAMQKGYI